MNNARQAVLEYLSAQNQLLTNAQGDLVGMAADMKLLGLACEMIDQFVNPGLYSELTLEQRLDRLLKRQGSSLATARFDRMYRLSKLPHKKWINQIKAAPDRGLHPDLLIKLTETKYLEEGVNIVLSGAAGVGKTTLSVAAGMQALTNGYQVRFFRMFDLATMLELKDDASFSRFLDSMARTRLLIIDDWGQELLSEHVLVRLNEIAERRYGVGSTMVTTHLLKDSLGSVAEKSTAVLDALMDRLFRESDIYVTLTGSSFRGKADEIRGTK